MPADDALMIVRVLPANRDRKRVSRNAGRGLAPEKKLSRHQQRSKTEKPARETLSITGLHRLTRLDRTTIRRRLAAANLKPVRERPREKLFDIALAIRALAAGGNGNGHVTSELTEARRKKTIAEAARVTLKLRLDRGELVPVSQIADELFQVIKALYLRVVKIYPRESAHRLSQCRSAADLAQKMEIDFGLIFDELRRNYPQLF